MLSWRRRHFPAALAIFLVCVYFGLVRNRSYGKPQWWHTSQITRSSNTNSPPPTESEHRADFPKKIWWKVGSRGTANFDRYIQSCLKQNPTYRHEILTDKTAETLVRRRYATRPDIIEAYTSLSTPMLHVDLLKYLIMYAEGGVWMDLDAECESQSNNIDTWIPEPYKNTTTLVVGLEFDGTRREAIGKPPSDDHPFQFQFTSWTVMARPGLSYMEAAINDTIAALGEQARWNNVSSIADLNMQMISQDQVVATTGPFRMTKSIVNAMTHHLNQDLTNQNFSQISAPKLLGDVLVLPKKAFGYHALHPEAWTPETETPVLVRHHFAGTWRNEKGGEGGG